MDAFLGPVVNFIPTRIAATLPSRGDSGGADRNADLWGLRVVPKLVSVSAITRRERRLSGGSLPPARALIGVARFGQNM